MNSTVLERNWVSIMTKVKDILDFLETVAPGYMKMEWDNVGLLCGDEDQCVTKVMVALDPFESVCREAKDANADLLLTHHPLIFQAPNAVTTGTELGRSILFLAKNGISAVNAHTNLDCAPGGVNDVLADTLGLADVSVIAPVGTDQNGEPWGLLRQGTVQEQSLADFLKIVKEKLGCNGLRYVDCGKAVHKVAVGGGSCGSELEAAAEAGCDTFVTADVKYNQFFTAREQGLNIIDAGHFHTENPVCKVLADKLQAAFPEITVVLSQKHTDCVKFF